MPDRPVARRERFEQLFRSDPDPWAFETSDYEREKRQATLAALSTRRFAQGLEIGCATGVLTEELLTVCDRMVGIDVAQTALDIAQRRLGSSPCISLRQGEVPRDWPEGSFDLIVFSEVLYFLNEAEIAQVSSLANGALCADGMCLLVNWTGPTDLPIDGDRAVALFAHGAAWRAEAVLECPKYRIDRLERS